MERASIILHKVEAGDRSGGKGGKGRKGTGKGEKGQMTRKDKFCDKIYDEKRAKREHDIWDYGIPPKKWKKNNKGRAKGHWGSGGGSKW